MRKPIMGILSGIAVAISLGVATQAMVSHGIYMDEHQGGVRCRGWMEVSENPKSIKVWIRDASDQVVASQAWGHTDPYNMLIVEAYAPSAASGTYTCDILFEELSDFDAETDWMDDQIVVQ